MTNKEKAQLLKTKVNQAINDLKRVDKNVTKDIMGSLRKLKLDIADGLKDVVRFQSPYYRAILDEIDFKIDEFSSRMQKAIRDGQNVSFGAGEKVSDDIFKTVQLAYGIPKLSDELIATAQEFTTDLITNMTDQMKDDIAKSLRRSLLTGEDSYNAARGIDKIIGVNKRLGYMNRSDTIARTEIGRAFSMARQAKDEEVVKIVPSMKKQWITTQTERVRDKDMGGGRGFVSHKDAHGQIRKVDEPFDVGGEQLMYPRDPAGKPENIINCMCVSVPYMEEWEE